ncbi:MAG TPA: chemotaxis response regulator protein-glutamate methylesterase, partial [Cellvibrionaceae bacterium]|nr:chemotaxis response regulator protein-glutamate methylesterase [Cellvibrionaceae bacterium]
MVYNVLIVDDSNFFQVRLKEIINEHPELKVVGIAANGREAVDMARDLKPDIISMDYEMPYMDGVSAIKLILSERPVPIVMFSSLTYEGARTTLDALAAGAVDFIPKNFAEVSRNSAELKRKLHETLLTFAKKSNVRVPAPTHTSSNPSADASRPVPAARPRDTQGRQPATPTPSVTPGAAPAYLNPAAHKPLETTSVDSRPNDSRPVESRPAAKPLRGRVRLVIIGSSTGGPMALTEVLMQLSASFSVPIVVVQHMPPNFTKALAERLDRQCQVRVKEAATGDQLVPGHVYIAPGGHQLIFERGRGVIKILPGDERMNYKPSVDITFASAANEFGGAVLGVVLTGMGADGCEGARLLKDKTATIWGQDEASCVVYGMPKAVASAGLTDEV